MADRSVHVTAGDTTTTVTIQDDSTVCFAESTSLTVEATPVPGEYLVTTGDEQQRVFAANGRDTTWVFHDGVAVECQVDEAGAARRRHVHHHGSLTAPMPATVIAVNVNPGDRVARGQTLILLEAMKMELPLKAPGDGTVGAIHCRAGELVQPGVSLIDLE